MRVVIIVIAAWLVVSILAAFVLGALVTLAKRTPPTEPAARPAPSRETESARPAYPRPRRARALH